MNVLHGAVLQGAGQSDTDRQARQEGKQKKKEETIDMTHFFILEVLWDSGISLASWIAVREMADLIERDEHDVQEGG